MTIAALKAAVAALEHYRIDGAVGHLFHNLIVAAKEVIAAESVLAEAVGGPVAPSAAPQPPAEPLPEAVREAIERIATARKYARVFGPHYRVDLEAIADFAIRAHILGSAPSQAEPAPFDEVAPPEAIAAEPVVTDALLPCPFCGKVPKPEEVGDSTPAGDGGYYAVECHGCGDDRFCGVHAGSPDEARDAWNTRTALSARTEPAPAVDADDYVPRDVEAACAASKKAGTLLTDLRYNMNRADNAIRSWRAEQAVTRRLQSELAAERAKVAVVERERDAMIAAGAMLRNAAYEAIPRPYPSSINHPDSAHDRWMAEFYVDPQHVKVKTVAVENLALALRNLPAPIQDRGVTLARAAQLAATPTRGEGG